MPSFPWLVWLEPLALTGLIAAAGPIAVHLLRRQRAARVAFASLRFVRAASTTALRLRRPSDGWLLVLRVAIVSAAAAALAQPVLVTAGRRAAWNAQISRAIVVDTSPSVAAAAGQREEAAVAESRGAVYARRIDTARLADGLLQAVAALASSPPSQREIVVVSDLQQGSLTPSEIALVPADIGLRFVIIDAPRNTERFQGQTLLGAPGIQSRVQEIHPTLEGTGVRLTPIAVPAAGLRLVNAGAAADVLLRAVAGAGAPAPSPEQPLAIVFASNPSTLSNVSRLSDPPNRSALRTILRMRRDASLADAAREHRRQGSSPGAPWMVVARDASDVPVVAANVENNELVLYVAGAPGDYLAVAVLRTALVASRSRPSWTEFEPARIPAAKLARWTRQPAEVDLVALKESARGDGRWVWILTVMLLGLEGLVRRPRGARISEPYADVA